jgi:hypothetical protein
MDQTEKKEYKIEPLQISKIKNIKIIEPKKIIIKEVPTIILFPKSKDY